MKELISVVVPMYFEEEVADECYKRLKDVMVQNDINYEFIFVNDGSTDRTMDILRRISKEDYRAKIVNFSRNFGHQTAVTAGIGYATGDAIVIIDADLQLITRYFNPTIHLVALCIILFIAVLYNIRSRCNGFAFSASIPQLAGISRGTTPLI